MIKFNPILMLAVAITAVSCNKDDPNATTDVSKVPTAIAFGVESIATKVAVDTTFAETIKKDANGFRVAAIKSDNSVYFDENARWNEDNQCFKTDTTYYYPYDNKPLSFYAIYPGRDMSIKETGGDVAVSFDYTSNGTDDIVAAVVRGKTKPEKYEPVALTFDHILTCLSIDIIGTDKDVTYTLLDDEIKYMKKGTYTFGSSTRLDDNWTNLASTYSSKSMIGSDIPTNTPAEFWDGHTVVPGEVKITLSWECRAKDKAHTLVSRYEDKVVTIRPTASVPMIGQNYRIHCKLANKDAIPITFSIEVNPWGNTDVDALFE